jgi:hypothetical protein
MGTWFSGECREGTQEKVKAFLKPVLSVRP